MRTYSGENFTLRFSQAQQVGQQAVGAIHSGGELPPKPKTGVDPSPLPHARFHQDSCLGSCIVGERVLGSQQVHVPRVALSHEIGAAFLHPAPPVVSPDPVRPVEDRKSTRLNSSHQIISYAVFCLKKKKKIETIYAQSTPLEQ